MKFKFCYIVGCGKLALSNGHCKLHQTKLSKSKRVQLKCNTCQDTGWRTRRRLLDRNLNKWSELFTESCPNCEIF